MSAIVRWGILSTGAIAKTFAAGVSQSQTGRLAAVGSRDAAKAAEFAKNLNIPRHYGSYEEVLADKEVQAVYIATPHPFHAEWAVRAAEAGKHILCEKPLGMNHAEAMAIVAAAQANRVFLMEAFMYRCHPQTAKLVELLREKVIGEVRVVQATFSFHAGFNPESRLFANALGGGGILDVGCYTTSISRLIAGAATGKDFADPLDVKGLAHLGTTGVDEWATGVLRFPGDILAQIATGVSVSQENVVRIYGSAGNIVLPNPFLANRQAADAGKIIIKRKAGTEEVVVPAAGTSYAYEADVAGRAILAGKLQADAPAVTPADSLGNMRTLDRWRESVGLVYEAEHPANYRQKLTTRAKTKIPTGSVTGLSKPVSKLVMGCDNQPNMPHAAVMFDDFLEHGGNTFDTAYVYAGGKYEQLLGHWIRHRGVRDQVVIIGKGAHTPECDPVNLTRQLHISLERLQTDHVDLYLMHRDNPAIPVGEFVDVLNEHLRAGRIRAFGGSNWSLERVDAANAYARQKGLTGFAAVSNNFSLAAMVQPVWGGCVAASDAGSRAWLARTQTPLFAWSSQARGFFTERGERRDEPELVRCWVSDENVERRRRAYELAAKRGVQPINIALAYVLNQPFPVHALIGPRTLEEFHSSLPSLSVELSPDDLRWLNLE